MKSNRKEIWRSKRNSELGNLLSLRWSSLLAVMLILVVMASSVSAAQPDPEEYLPDSIPEAPLARAITSVLVNGLNQVAVAPDTPVTVTVTVYGGGSGSDNWNSTGYRIEGGSWLCVDTPDHPSGTNSESFFVSAPSTYGSYNLDVIAYSDNGCTTGASGTYTKSDAILVVASNPTLSGSCGVDMVLIIDSSGSIDNSELTSMKTAFRGFVDAFLPNTPTQIAVVDFDSLGHLTQDYTSDSNAIKNAIDSATSGGNTNWEDALEEAHAQFDNRVDKPDIYVFASDGNPNRYGDGSIGASETLAVAEAAEDANQIKSDGVRIITLGIGNDLDANNLIAISSSDAYYSSNFDTLAETLAGIAQELCGGTVTVRKIVNDVPSGNWEFTTSVTGGTSTPASGYTDPDGYLVFSIDPTDTTATVDVTETPQSGYAFVSASCFDQAQNPVGTQGDGTVTGIPVSSTDAISCTFNNIRAECVTDDDCDYMDQDYCDGDNWVHEAGMCVQGTCVLNSTPTNCNNGLFCDGQETCDAGACVPGTPIVCDTPPTQFPYTCYASGVCSEEQQGACVYDLLPDPTPPVVSNLVLIPNPAGWYCAVNELNGTVDEDCRNIAGAEYYVTTMGTCEPQLHLPYGTMSASDGAFDSTHEDIFAHLDVFGLSDGGNLQYCVRANNTDGTWSSCECRRLEIDTIHPDNTTDLSVSNVHWADSRGKWVCADNFTLTTNFCDTQSCIAGAEYFVVPPQNFNMPAGSGHPMQPSDGAFSEPGTRCDLVYDDVPNMEYSEGTHEIRTEGLDCACNWGKIIYYTGQKVVIDRTAPVIEKAVSEPKIRCDYLGDQQEAAECWMINQSTAITLSGYDVDNAWDHVYSDNIVLHYRYRFKLNYSDEWGEWSNWVDVNANSTTFSFEEDSIHEIEYYVSDMCGNPSPHYYEIDIVDSKPPITTKEVGEPKVACMEGDPNECDYYMTQQTPITLTCADQEPHPSGGEALYYRYRVNEGEWTGWMAYVGPFTYPQDSRHTLEYYCVDALGNSEVVQSEVDVVDTQPPEFTKTITGPSIEGNHDPIHYYLTRDSVISLTCEDGQPHPVGGVVLSWEMYWKLNWDDEWQYLDSGNGTTSVVFSNLSDSFHKLAYTCSDALGNSFSDIEYDAVDNLPPITTKEVGEPKVACMEGDPNECDYYMTQQTPITLTCADQEPHPSGGEALYYRYRVNEGEWTGWMAYVGPFTYPQDSRHTLEYYCVDALGNTEVTQTEVDVVDTQPPVLSKVVGEPNVPCEQGQECHYYVTTQTPITITCTDSEPHPVGDVAIHYKWLLNGEIWSDEYTSENGSVTFTYPTDSHHELTYWCQDGLGNEARDSEIDIVDSQPPVTVKELIGPQVPCTEGQDCHAYITQATLVNLTCADQDPHPVGLPSEGALKYRYKINEGEFSEWMTYIEPFSYPEDSRHTLEYYCVDALGNTEETQTEVDIVDSQPPSLVKVVGEPKVVIHQGGEGEASGPIDVLIIGSNGEEYVQDVVSKLTGYPGINSITVFDARYSTPELSYLENYDAVLVWSNYVYADKVALGNVLADYADNGGGVTLMVFSWYNGFRLEGRYMTDGYGSIPLGDYNPYTAGTLGTIYDPSHPVMDGVTSFATNDYRSGYSGALNPGAVLLASYSDGEVLAAVHESDGYRSCDLGFFPPSQDANYGSWDPSTDGVKLMGNCLLWTAGASSGEDVTYITQQTPITMTCEDMDPHPVGGITVRYRYSVDGGEFTDWMTYTEPFTFHEDSVHYLEYYCEDALGNSNGTMEEPLNEIDKVDSTSPETVKTYGQPLVQREETKWITSQTPITLDATDGGLICAVGVNKTYYNWTRVDDSYCWNGCETPENLKNMNGMQLQDGSFGYEDGDGGEGGGYYVPPTSPWVEYTGPFTIHEDSCHMITYYSEDLLGNVEMVKSQCTFVDNLPPASMKEVGLPNLECTEEEHCDYWVTSSTPIALSCSDQEPHPVEGETLYFRYSVDGENMTEWMTYEGPISFNEDSVHYLEYYCTDELGNTEIVKNETDKVDNTPPVTTKIIEGCHTECTEEEECDYWVNKHTTFGFSGTDGGAICAVGVDETYVNKDGHGWHTYDPNNNISFFFEGTHTIDYYSVDRLGNTEETIHEVDKVDNTMPWGWVRNPVSGRWYHDGSIFFTEALAVDYGHPPSGVAECDFQAIDIHFEDLTPAEIVILQQLIIHNHDLNDILEFLQGRYTLVDLGTTPFDGTYCTGNLQVPMQSGITDKAYLVIRVKDRSCNEYYDLAREYINGDVILMDFDNSGPRVVITDADGLHGIVEGGHAFTVMASIEEYSSGARSCWGELYTEEAICDGENCSSNLTFVQQYPGILLDPYTCRITGNVPPDAEDGDYRFFAVAQDNEFNIGNDSVRFSVDSSAPNKVVYSPVPGGIYGPNGIPINVWMADTSGIAPETVQYRIYENEESLNGIPLGEYFDTGWLGTTLTEGTVFEGNYTDLFNITGSGMVSGTTYYLRVRGCDVLYTPPLPNGSEIPPHCADPVSSIIIDLDPPLGPTNVVINSGTITWTAATDALSGVHHYNIYAGSEKIGETTGLSFANATNASATYYVSATDNVGNEGSKVQANPPSSPPSGGGGTGGTTYTGSGGNSGSRGSSSSSSSSTQSTPVATCQELGGVCSTSSDCCSGYCTSEVCSSEPEVGTVIDPIDVLAPELVDTGSLVTVVLRHHESGEPLAGAELDILTPTGEVMKRTTDENGQTRYSAQDEGWYKYEVPGYEKGSVTFTYSKVKNVVTTEPKTTGQAAPPEDKGTGVQSTTGLLFGVLAPELAGLLVLLLIVGAYLVYRRVKSEG